MENKKEGNRPNKRRTQTKLLNVRRKQKRGIRKRGENRQNKVRNGRQFNLGERDIYTQSDIHLISLDRIW